jgi:hypothetical protein
MSILASQIPIKHPPTAAPDTDIGLPVVGALNVSMVGPYAVHILYFRPNDLCWPSKPPTADPKLTIENELKSNCEYDIEKIVRKNWVLTDGRYESRYLVLARLGERNGIG